MPDASARASATAKGDRTSAKEKNAAEVEASIRAKVACEKAAYTIQWTLLEPGVTEEELEAAAHVLQPHHYEDVVTERALDGLCGYPPCTKAAPRKGQGPKLHVSIDHHKVYDISSLHSFCGHECARRSSEFAASLSTASLFLRKGLPTVADVASPTSTSTASGQASCTATATEPAPCKKESAATAAEPAASAAAAWSAATSPTPSTKKRASEAGAATLGPVVERPPVPMSVPVPPPQRSGGPGAVEGYRPRFVHSALPPAASGRGGRAPQGHVTGPLPDVGVMSLAEAEAAAGAARRLPKGVGEAGGVNSQRQRAERTGKAALGNAERTVRLEYG